MKEATSPDDAGTVLEEPGSQACLFITVSYSDVVDAVKQVVATAADHVLSVPALGDFVELRFADAGLRPSYSDLDGSSRGPVAAADRIAEALTRPTVGADENYFALAVVDQSAAAVVRLLDECRSNRVIADLRVACRGFAALDDRPAPTASDQGAGSNVIVAQAGMWTERTLAARLQEYAEELFHYFATTHQAGVTGAELEEIRNREGLTEPNPAVPLVGEDSALDLQPDLPAQIRVASSSLPGQAARALSALGEPSPPSTPLDARLARGLSDPAAPADLVVASGGDASADPGAAPSAPSLSAAQATETAPQASGAEAPTGHRARRWRLPSRLRSSGPPGEGVDSETRSGTEEVAVTAIVPVFLLLYGVTSPDEQVNWRAARSLSVSIDRKITSSRPVAFKTRAFPSVAGGAGTMLQDAGSLTERDIKRPDSQIEFEQSLSSVRKAVASDLGALSREALPTGRPVVVIFAVDVPVADVISTEMYQRLTRQASVIWVVPERSADLISPAFTAGVPVLTFHDGTADEIVGLLHAWGPSPSPSDGPEQAPDAEPQDRHASTR